MGEQGTAETRFSGRDLRESALDAFPDIRPELEEDDGVHSVMAALDRATVTAARHNDLPRARRILSFVDSILGRPDLDPEIPNAVCISFIEPEVLAEFETGRQLWKDAPQRIRRLVLENKNRIRRPGE